MRPGQIVARQRRSLARYVRREVYPYSAYHRRRLDQAGLGRRGVLDQRDLARLPPVTLEELPDSGELILRPTEQAIRQSGDPTLRWHLFWARVFGRRTTVNRQVIDVAFKPIHWHTDGSLLVGSSGEDLDRLGELGRRWLEQAGLRSSDLIVDFLPSGPRLPFWQLALGARQAGLGIVHLTRVPRVEDLASLGPTALAGSPADLTRVLERLSARGDAKVRTLLVAGDRLTDADRVRLAALTNGAAVVSAWAPPGVRALWSECRGGQGFHTWPDTEVVEVLESGEVVWTAVGWRGTALLRLRTGVYGWLEEGPCPKCGRTTPRLLLR